MRILHAPLNLANDPSSLVAGLNALSHEAHLATIASSPYTDVGDIDLSFPANSSLTRQIAKWSFCQKELPGYDILHYHFGRSILDYGNGSFMLMDMKAAHRRGQKIALSFHGCEVRDLQAGGCPHPCSDQVCKQGNQRARIETCLALADLVYVSTPDLLPAVPGAKLLPQSVAGIADAGLYLPNTEGSLHIAHLPSMRSKKGSEQIITAVTELQEEGLDIEFTLIENQSHEQALEAMQAADLIIDQILIGWYGVVSIEAAAYGKPVLVYIDERAVALSGLEAPPFTNVSAESLKDAIRKFYENRAELVSAGLKNRDFVLTRHSAIANAERLLEDYQRVLGERRPTSTQLSDTIIPHKVSCE